MYRIIIIFVLSFFINSVSAQKYILDPLFNDSVKCQLAVKKDTLWVTATPYTEISFPKGMEIEASGKANSSYFAFECEGKHYLVFQPEVKFSDNNPEDVVNPLTEDNIKRHSKMGHFYASSTPAISVVLLLLIVLLAYGLTLMSKKLAPIALIVIPISLLLVSIFEIVGLRTLGSDAFWWCDNDKYGFFGSLFRLIPFGLTVALQYYSIFLFEKILFVNSPEDTEKGISLKPALIGLSAFIPIMIAYFAIVQQWIGWQGEACNMVMGILAFGTLVIGILISFKKNISTMGTLKGFGVSLFSIVYLIGLLVAIWGVIVVLIKLIIQVIMVIAAIIAIAVLGEGRVYKGRDGHIYRDNIGGTRRID